MRFLTRERPGQRLVRDCQVIMLSGTPCLASLRRGMVVVGRLLLLGLIIQQRVRQSVGLCVLLVILEMEVVVIL